MNYGTTKELLDMMSNYIDITSASVSSENKDWKGRSYRSDFVTLIKKDRVNFEVFDNEIIIGYFNNHTHFEDYTFELSEGEPDYVARAKEFLIHLFTLPLRHCEKRKGTVLVSEKYCFVLPDHTEDCTSSVICHHLLFGFNPFAKKSIVTTTWQYDVQKECFTTKQPWKANPDALEVIRIDDGCYIEVFENKGAYSYLIEHLDFDDYNGYYYWLPMDDGRKSLFDTKEKALEDAKQSLTSLRTKYQEP